MTRTRAMTSAILLVLLGAAAAFGVAAHAVTTQPQDRQPHRISL
jgi:hypothetical protein